MLRIAPNIEEIIDLAEKGHNAEILEYNRIHIKPHDPTTCEKCLSVAAARAKIDEAASQGSYLVLYIP